MTKTPVFGVFPRCSVAGTTGSKRASLKRRPRAKRGTIRDVGPRNAPAKLPAPTPASGLARRWALHGQPQATTESAPFRAPWHLWRHTSKLNWKSIDRSFEKRSAERVNVATSRSEVDVPIFRTPENERRGHTPPAPDATARRPPGTRARGAQGPAAGPERKHGHEDRQRAADDLPGVPARARAQASRRCARRAAACTAAVVPLLRELVDCAVQL